jgi:hypothetical protein
VDNTATWVGKVQDNKFISQSNKTYPYIFWDGNGHNLSADNID